MTIIDNRTSVNIANNAADWTSDKSPADDTTEFFEGAESISDQASNSNFEIFDTITSTSLSNHTMYHLFKDSLGATSTSGGTQFIMGDGTARRGYVTGGSDSPLFPLNNFWAMNRLDTSNLPTTPTPIQQSGTGDPTFTTITQVGYGTLHNNKAVGSIDNMYIDELSYIANGSRALEIRGGTSGTPITFATTIGDDQTAGIGLFNNPKGSEYGIYGSIGYGDSTGTASYFDDSNVQVFIDGRGFGIDTIDQVMLGGTGTQSFVLDSSVIVGLLDDSTLTGGRANWDCTASTHDILKITASTFIDGGDFLFPTIDNTNKFVKNCTFVNCELITASTMLFQNNTVKLPLSQGVLISSNSHQIDNTSFDLTGGSGTKYSLVIDTAGTYDLDGCEFLGANGTTLYDVYNTSNGVVTLNITNSSSPPTEANSTSSGVGTLSINVSVNVNITVKDASGNNIQNARVHIEADSGGYYPYQDTVTITRSTTVASVSHTAHGMVANQYVVIRGAVQQEYNGIRQITNVTTNAYDYTVSGSPVTPATGAINSTFRVMSELTTVAGLATETMKYISSQPIIGKVRKSTTSPLYSASPISGTINGSDFVATVTMSSDE